LTEPEAYIDKALGGKTSAIKTLSPSRPIMIQAPIWQPRLGEAVLLARAARRLRSRLRRSAADLSSRGRKGCRARCVDSVHSLRNFKPQDRGSSPGIAPIPANGKAAAIGTRT